MYEPAAPAPAPMAAARLPPATAPTPAPTAVPLATVPIVRVRPLKCLRAARRLNAYNPAAPPPIAAPFFPPAKAPTPTPPAMIAAVLALRPNFDFLRRVWPSADTIVPVMTSRVRTSIKASNLFIPYLLARFLDIHADLVRN